MDTNYITVLLIVIVITKVICLTNNYCGASFTDTSNRYIFLLAYSKILSFFLICVSRSAVWVMHIERPWHSDAVLQDNRAYSFKTFDFYTFTMARFGFKNGTIKLEEIPAAYYSGQTINGSVVFNLRAPLNYSGGYLIKYFCLFWCRKKSSKKGF